MNARILLVEDNPLTAKGLQYLLENAGYRVTIAANLQTARDEIATEHFDLLLLDVGLPDGTGFALIEECQYGQTPVIFLTAKDDERDVVHGFELGAEDYITKPFHSRELLLRIQRALRRQHPASAILTAGEISLNLETGEVLVGDHAVTLTALERKILTCLLENPGHVVTRERLLDEIWSASGSVVNDNTLSVYLKRLRQKLGLPKVIETIKGVGYRLKEAHAA